MVKVADTAFDSRHLHHFSYLPKFTKDTLASYLPGFSGVLAEKVDSLDLPKNIAITAFVLTKLFTKLKFLPHTHLEIEKQVESTF